MYIMLLMLSNSQVSVATDSSGLHLVLYQYPTCPFCCKVRAFLDFYGLSYDVVEVDPVLRTQTKWSDYKKVPILLASVGDGKYVVSDGWVAVVQPTLDRGKWLQLFSQI